MIRLFACLGVMCSVYVIATTDSMATQLAMVVLGTINLRGALD